MNLFNFYVVSVVHFVSIGAYPTSKSDEIAQEIQEINDDGGALTKASWPWLVSLFRTHFSKDHQVSTRYFCGGILISERAVLTVIIIAIINVY